MKRLQAVGMRRLVTKDIKSRARCSYSRAFDRDIRPGVRSALGGGCLACRDAALVVELTLKHPVTCSTQPGKPNNPNLILDNGSRFDHTAMPLSLKASSGVLLVSHLVNLRYITCLFLSFLEMSVLSY